MKIGVALSTFGGCGGTGHRKARQEGLLCCAVMPVCGNRGSTSVPDYKSHIVPVYSGDIRYCGVLQICNTVEEMDHDQISEHVVYVNHECSSSFMYATLHTCFKHVDFPLYKRINEQKPSQESR